MTRTTSARKGRKYHKSASRSYGPDLVGLHWQGENFNEYDPTDESTIYEPLQDLGDICLPVTFDVSKENFEVAAALDGAQFGAMDMMDMMPDVDLADYAVVASADAEGYALDANKDGYIESFFTDEVEFYLGLFNDANDNGIYEKDELVGAVEVEIELTGKADILFNAGTGLDDAFAFLSTLSDDTITKYIEEIEISFASFADPTDPVVGAIAGLATMIGEEILADNPNLAGLIEFEADDPSASKWAKSVFPTLLAEACADLTTT
jgi:hypothetical protein